MSRFAIVAIVAALVGALIAAPVPPVLEAKALVAGLSDPSQRARDESARALRGRADALPWLRRAARSADKNTAGRPAELLAPHEQQRQKAVAKAINSCIRDGHIDLFIEWHQYWRPANKEELWPVGPRAADAGMQMWSERLPPGLPNELEDNLAMLAASEKHHFHDSPNDFDQRQAGGGVWHVRTNRLTADVSGITFASVAGPIQHGWANMGRFFALGPVRASWAGSSFLCCDGDIENGTTETGIPRGCKMGNSVVVCRGNVSGKYVGSTVLLVHGDIDLTPSSKLHDSLIRASREIRLPKNVTPENCTIEPHAKNATAPYKFFALTDVGLSLADDEEGLVVTDVKAGTPFGNCGIAKGDLVRAIDDSPAGHSEEFRKKVRRALVRQGDCLLTVVRGDKILDLPVFFHLSK